MLRVVVYAEGAGELTGRDKSRQRRPGTPFTGEELGSAHLLMRRCLEHTHDIATERIQFEEPLRLRARLPNGSDLQTERYLRQLLSWADEEFQPDLVIVLVDKDKDEAREARLKSYIQDLPVAALVSVAVQEFEAWLIADPQALKTVLRAPVSLPKPPEQLGRRQAKQLLQEWSEQHASKHEPAEIRRQLAETCDLETLRQQCPAFAGFLQRLQALALD
ncbi:DUF4276 family protein [Archangium primigenium]|uniref:DUF4276 family protein n=1 Tax=[Archangium] primigenium TaxID=2792470 RepID=UPI0019574EDE|nr:DUF4276 family protein [Archangium primigenium]MBM7112396.1 DUF4276 family protein [Archangium primigenium]